ncbi:NUDIX domain-containing protein [Aliiroseovarius zhejiangensis]|uniref:NUDIX domain-containing protein n=1 Tax=Aliiroseovarius zhejiangensis TaxID=1632025 RepID=A0ABQ3J7F1_9RHOB|nr:NUDIX hydrolase [Aliiroseovarius zhejiangensis]GHF08510.1 NUDIX domain-containing protein [Aliiroseovarius zhejiangensis]
MHEFIGAKLVLLVGGRVATILRDDLVGIQFPGMWDFPGGGRDKGETPEQCVLRETQEELSLTLTPDDLIWRTELDSPSVPGTTSWWFAAALPAHRANDISLGDEGQCWALMTPDDWLAHPLAIAHFKPRLRAALKGLAQHAVEQDLKSDHPPIKSGQ